MRRRIIAVVLAGLYLIAAAAFARAGGHDDATIAVTGNQHVGADMIRSCLENPAGKLDADALDAGLKKLYATGLFADVTIVRQNGTIVVKVVENPAIGRIAFEGNKKVKDADLKKALQSKEGGPLSRPLVHDDVMRLAEVYRQRGYFEAKIDPQTIKAKNGREDLVFAIREGDKLAVRQIAFAGNRAFSDNKLKGAVKSGATNVLSFLLDNDIYDADRIDNDRDLIRRFYLAHGYADVRVSSSAAWSDDKKGVVLTFEIDEGPQYRFGKIDIASTLSTVDASALRQYLHMQSGDVYDAGAVEKTTNELGIALAGRGEPFAAVVARPDRNPARHVIDVVYAIDPGKRLYVERIDIHGNVRTRDAVIRREFDFGEGDPFNRALLDRAERHLKGLGYFKSAKITPRAGSAPDRLILDVALVEQDTGNFGISGGYSTSDGWLASISISERNFLGTGDIAKASVTYGQYARGVDLAFTDPWFLGQRLSLGGEVFDRETLANANQSYNSALYGGKVTVGTPINEQLGVGWNYSLYNQSLSLAPALGTASLPVRQAAAAGPLWVSSVGIGLTYATLDDFKNPTSGVRAQTNNDVAGLGGAVRFARNTNDVRYYHQLGGDVVGMVRAQSGYVTPWGGEPLPLLDGFFGGPQLIRGFAPNGFGPRDIAPGTTQDNIGGNVYWTTSAELQAPMPAVPADANLKVALFSDVGSLWANGASGVSSLSTLTPAQQIANARSPRASVGASLIWDSPFGALRVDYAYPVAKQPYDVTQRLNFSAGGF